MVNTTQRTLFLMGNEAIGYGAVRAGAEFAAAYPGTPSTEILETAAGLEGIHAEWCVNEKVALETAVGASRAGLRSLVTMKHVGLNVAADPLLTLTETGVGAGLVIVSADDPGMSSSQNEQDSRHYAKFAKIPMLEPADSQEAYDFVAEAFALGYAEKGVVSRFAVPDRIVFVGEIDKTSVGKLDKKVLREKYGA